jgi:branched-chain amino acid transport system permease protein
VLPVALMAVAAAVLVAAGVVFLVELLQRLFSQDYRALAKSSAAAPPIVLAGRHWVAAAWATWLVPACLLAVGGSIGWGAARSLGVLAQAHAQEGTPDTPAPAATLAEEVRA